MSFGGTEREICRHICKMLQERGYDPWFDEERIPFGEDWRKRITEGIRESDAALVFLSKHSIEDSSVCQDELRISVNLLEGNIQTVLMEEGVNPPASVQRIQWVDMSGWKELLNLGGKRYDGKMFAPWFRERMDEICEALERSDGREAAQERRTIRERLGVSPDTGKQDDLLRHGLVGREWLSVQVTEWLKDPNGKPLCVLYGEPGIGKSAFAAHAILENPQVVTGVFCESSRPYDSSPKMVAKTLAYLLACRLPDYRSVLANMLKEEPKLDQLNASDLFYRLVAGPLRNLTIDGEYETQCVIVDGLDECARENADERTDFARTLASDARRFPPWLRILVTSQELPELQPPLSEGHILRLSGEQAENRKDVRLYLEKRLGERFREESVWEDALEMLTERSGGVFLYAELVSQSILDGQMSIYDTEQFPEGLAASFERWFSGYFPDMREYRQRFRDPLGMILVSPEALPIEELQTLTGWSESETEDFLMQIKPLLRRDRNVFQKETVSLSHDYLRQWLGSEDAGRFRASVRDALKTMTGKFYKLCKSDVDSLTAFEALHLAELLEEHGKRQDYDEVMECGKLLMKILEAGNFCMEWGELDAARSCYEQAKEMALYMVWHRGELEDCWYLIQCCIQIESLLRMTGQMEELKELSAEFQQHYKHAAEKATAKLKDMEELPKEVSDTLKNAGLSDSDIEKATTKLKTIEELPKEISNQLTNAEVSGSDIETSDEEGIFQKIANSLDRQMAESDDPNRLKAMNLLYMGRVHSLNQTGKYVQALEWCQKGVAIAEKLVLERGSQDDKRTLWGSYAHYGLLLGETGNLEEKLNIFRKCLLIAEQLARKKGKPENQWYLAKSRYYLGGILLALDQPQEALNYLKTALPIAEQLTRRQKTPDNQGMVANIHSFIGVVFAMTGKSEEALNRFQRVLQIRRQLAQKPGRLDDRRNLAETYYRIAETREADSAFSNTWEERLNALSDAREQYRNALNIVTVIMQKRGSYDDQRDKAACRHKLTDIQWEESELNEALKVYRDVRKTYTELVSQCDIPEHWQYLCASENNIAEILEENGDLDEALEGYRNDLAIAEKLVERWNAPSDQENLAVSCWNIAQFKHAPKEERLSLAKKGVEIAQTLLDTVDGDAYPGYPELYQELVKNFQDLIEALKCRTESKAAFAGYAH